MFHKEFYPTPVEVLDMMAIECSGKIVLEPHAGKGDIVKYLNSHGALAVACCEINPDLRSISGKYGDMIGEDFLKITAEDISHVDMIVMNPPFSNADEHILHAWEIAPEGCEIISLCNWETVENGFSIRRNRLVSKVHDHGIKQCLGSVFDTAERKTGVDIGLIKLYKPVVNDHTKYEGFFMEEEPEEECADGIMSYNEIRATVNRYVAAAKKFKEVENVMSELGALTSPLGVSAPGMTLSYNDHLTSSEQYLKWLQKGAWDHLFSKMNLKKFVTSKVMEDINKFVETQHNVPFTMRNVYHMFDIIVGTRENTLNKALEEAIDNFTRYTHENRFHVEGWKTNSGHMLNRKFIVHYCVEKSWSGKMAFCHSGHVDKINDLAKVLCNITGTDYNKVGDIRDAYKDKDHRRVDLETNTWYDWGFFQFKVFKKGTMHVKFMNEDDWYLLNQKYGELKGFSLYESAKKAA